MAQPYFHSMLVGVAGFLLGVSVTAVLMGQIVPEPGPAPQTDIFAQSGGIRTRIGPTQADIETAKTKTQKTFRDAFGKAPEPVLVTEQDLDTPEVIENTPKALPQSSPKPALAQAAAARKTEEFEPAAAAPEPPKPMPAQETTLEYGLHLASLSRPENVAEMISSLEASFADELSSRSFYEMEGENAITGRTFIRVVSAGYASREAADALCKQLKSKGQYCAVIQIQR